MKIETYKCYLCKEEKPRLDLLCLWWNSGVIPQRYELTSSLDLANKHLCTKCIEIIKDCEL